MKNILSFFLILSLLTLIGCSDDTTDPNGSSGWGSGGGITFTVSLVQDNNQAYWFEFKPSTGAVINTVTINCTAANVTNEQVQGDGTTVFTSTNPAYIQIPDPTVLAQNQVWSFTIAGKIGSSTGTTYSVTATCKIQ